MPLAAQLLSRALDAAPWFAQAVATDKPTISPTDAWTAVLDGRTVLELADGLVRGVLGGAEMEEEARLLERTACPGTCTNSRPSPSPSLSPPLYCSRRQLPA